MRDMVADRDGSVPFSRLHVLAFAAGGVVTSRGSTVGGSGAFVKIGPSQPPTKGSSRRRDLHANPECQAADVELAKLGPPTLSAGCRIIPVKRIDELLLWNWKRERRRKAAA